MTLAPPRPPAIEPVAGGIFRPAARPLLPIASAGAAFVLLIAAGVALRAGQDIGLARDFNTLHIGLIGSVSSAVYHVFAPAPAIALTVIVAALLWRVRGLRTGIAFGAVVALTWLPTEVIKVVVNRARPSVAVMPHPFHPVQVDASFPSGHTAFIVAFVIAVSYMYRDSPWRSLLLALGSLVVCLVALSLAIDAVHYPSDIAASIVWSAAVRPRRGWYGWTG